MIHYYECNMADITPRNRDAAITVPRTMVVCAGSIWIVQEKERAPVRATAP
jgi:hypothetical protein